jgi:hypothetical protein
LNYGNAHPGSAIDFRVTGTILLGSLLPDLAADVDITGPGADQLAVSGPGEFGYPVGPLFTVDAGATVTMSGLTVANGYNNAGPGGVLNHGTLTLEECTVADNTHDFGNPDNAGGGIFNDGTMTIRGSTVSGNRLAPSALGYGGGIFNAAGGVMVIDSSTVTQNTITHGYGGGVSNDGTLDVRFSTVTQNNAACGDGWGIANAGPHLDLYDSIVAGNFHPPTCTGRDLAGGFTGSFDLIGVGPVLGPLQYNGGHTQTHAPQRGSPALDAGDNAGAPRWDQRGPGFPRIHNGRIDIGAVEAEGTGTAPAGGPSVRATAATAAPVSVRVPISAMAAARRQHRTATAALVDVPIGAKAPAAVSPSITRPRAAVEDPAADMLGRGWL